MSQRQLTIHASQIQANQPYQLIQLKGFINAQTNHQFESSLNQTLNKNPQNLVIDTQDLQYLNSTGLSALIHFQQQFQKKGYELCLIKIPHHVAVVIYQMGLSQIVPVLRDEAEAQKYLEKDSLGNRSFNNWQQYLEKNFPEKRKMPTQKKNIFSKGPRSILLVEPQSTEFAAVLEMRLHNPHIQFTLAASTMEALESFKKHHPELIMIRHTGPESDELVRKIKMDLEAPLSSLTKIYPRNSHPQNISSFKIWENDYFIEPFEIFELFSLAESEMVRIDSERSQQRQQVSYQFLSHDQYITQSSEFTQFLLKLSPLNTEKATRLLSAYNEAVDNSHQHGNLKNPQKSISVTYMADHKKISLMIRDQGKGFEYQEFTQRLNEASVSNKVQHSRRKGRQGGLGILLMVKCCDQISYQDNGQSVCLEMSVE